MASRLNGTSNQQAVPSETEAVVAKPLHELPKQERRKITTELLRIHNLVNALEFDLHRDDQPDKADVKRLS